MTPRRPAVQANRLLHFVASGRSPANLTSRGMRFWESKFPQLRPLKGGGGRRYHRPEDLALLRRIRQCLYEEGYTIRGMQKLLNGMGETGSTGPEASPAPTLFPLEPSSKPRAPLSADEAAKPTRAPARRLDPTTKVALAEIRREGVAARELLEQLPRPRAEP